MLIYGAIIFLLVTLTSIAMLNWLLPNKSQRRLQALAQTPEKSNWVKKAVDVARPFAKLSIPEGKWEDSPLRLKFINAGCCLHRLLPASCGTAGPSWAGDPT